MESEKKNNITVHRFRYFLPAFQTLAYEGGILANLKRNKLNYLLIPLFILFQLLSLYRLNKKIKYDVVHAHWIIPQGLTAVLARTISNHKYKLLVTSHGGDLFALKGNLFRLIKSWIIQHADHITVVSEAMKSYCEKLDIDKNKITVCSMGVDLQFAFVKQVPFKNRDGLIFVGRLVEKKGVRYLIEAMVLVSKRLPSIELVIVGDGPDRNYLESLVTDRKLQQHISFVGSVSNHQVPAYLNKAKIAVMPSVIASDGDQEGLGLVAVEAMGCGCVVVASDLPAVRDVIIDGNTGIMATPASSESLAEAIIKLTADDNLAENIADQGREYVLKKYDWQHIGNKYQDIIDNL